MKKIIKYNKSKNFQYFIIFINYFRSFNLLKEQIEREKKYKYTIALFNNNFEGYQNSIVYNL